MLSQPSLANAGQLILIAIAAIAAAFDIHSRRIPNRLVLAGIVIGFGWNGYAFGLSGLARAAEGLGLGFVLYFPLYLLRARGAGDVKLLAAIGSITGPANIVWIFLYTAILGGIIALLWVVLRGRMQKTLFNMSWIVRDLSQMKAPYRSSAELDVMTTKGERLPHGAMIATGVIAFILIARRIVVL